MITAAAHTTGDRDKTKIKNPEIKLICRGGSLHSSADALVEAGRLIRVTTTRDFIMNGYKIQLNLLKLVQSLLSARLKSLLMPRWRSAGWARVD